MEVIKRILCAIEIKQYWSDYPEYKVYRVQGDKAVIKSVKGNEKSENKRKSRKMRNTHFRT